MPGRTVRILKSVAGEVLRQALEEPRRECCGLLAGREGLITRIFPATNAAADTARNYEIAAGELFALMREMRAAGVELMGIYHSHPNGKNEPSLRDVERAYYPQAAFFIVSAGAEVAAVRAFSIRDGRVEELKLELE